MPGSRDGLRRLSELRLIVLAGDSIRVRHDAVLVLGKAQAVEAVPGVVNPGGRFNFLDHGLAVFTIVNDVDSGVDLAGNNVVGVGLQSLVELCSIQLVVLKGNVLSD